MSSAEPTIGEVRQAWIEEATRVGLQRVKKVLGSTYADLVPGCDTASVKAESLAVIGMRETA